MPADETQVTTSEAKMVAVLDILIREMKRDKKNIEKYFWSGRVVHAISEAKINLADTIHHLTNARFLLKIEPDKAKAASIGD
jgi:hypothetical protein